MNIRQGIQFKTKYWKKIIVQKNHSISSFKKKKKERRNNNKDLPLGTRTPRRLVLDMHVTRL